MYDTLNPSPLPPSREVWDEIGLKHFDYISLMFVPWGTQSSAGWYSPSPNYMERYLI